MITIQEYFQGLDDTVVGRRYLTARIWMNAAELLRRVNGLLDEVFPGKKFHVSSGFRTPQINERAGGKRRSYHMVGMAVDLADDGTLDTTLLLNPEPLTKFALWLEHPDFTPGWTHLDIGDRMDRPVRIFKP